MKKALKWLDINFEPLCMAVIFFMMAGLITLQVILRFVFEAGFAWGEEVARYIFVWLVFVSIPYAARNSRHIGIDFLREKLPVPLKKAYTLAIDVAAIVMFALFLIGAIGVVQDAIRYGDMSQTIHASMNWLHVAPVVGYTLIEVRLLQCLVWKLRHYHCSYELFLNVNGRYSGATDVFFMPQAQRTEDLALLNPDVVAEQAQLKAGTGGIVS